jgi:hypothetical protein
MGTAFPRCAVVPIRQAIVPVPVAGSCLRVSLKGHGFSRAVSKGESLGFSVCVRSRLADSGWNKASGF